MPNDIWDGSGVDPWLPERLASEIRLTRAERRMYASWWGSFSDWMVGVRRAVLRNAVPDPHAIWSQAPLWTELMGGFVNGPVLDTVGLAYDALFGEGYAYDIRPRVTAYLSQVTNRMVRTPEDVYDAIAQIVARSASEGASIPTIAERIGETLDTAGTDNWRGRAVTVARTETIGALNFGRFDAFTAVNDVLGGDLQHQWLATLDRRTREWHLAADGQRVPAGTPFTVDGESLMFPGDPGGSAHNVVNCRCSTLLVRPGESVDMTGRGFTDSDDWWAKRVAQAT